jgi:hypothetical protein
MQLRERFQTLREILTPFLAVIAFGAVCALIIWAVPPHVAAVLIGIFSATLLYYFVLYHAQLTTQLSIFWAAVALSSDVAYAKLNDWAPVTVVNAIAKLGEGLVKLIEGIVKSVGIPTGEARIKVSAVIPDFLWAVILTVVGLMILNFIAKHRSQ